MFRPRVFACRGAALLVGLLTAGCLTPPASSAQVALSKGGPLSPVLKTLSRPAVRALPARRQARIAGVAPSGPGSLIRHGDRVLVSVRFEQGAVAALPQLREAGGRVVAASRRYQRVTAQVPQAQLPALTAVPGVASVVPVRTPIVRAFEPCEGGSVVSEGVEQLNVPPTREPPFNVEEGEGITVGVLSDSLNQATEAVSPAGEIATKEPEDVLSKDLPGAGNGCPGQGNPVDDLQDYEPGPEGEEPFDEGRGMLQIVHDVAPKAELAFNSAFNGELAFAEGIENLAEVAGAQVIVDDVGYFEEPFFQDGPVAAAVDKVSENGVTYLSAAGNDNLFDGEGNEIASWEAPAYRDSGACPQEVAALKGFNAGHCLDFNPGAPTDRTFGIKVEPGEVLSLDLQWAEPWEGVETDLDAFLLNANGELLTGSVEDNVASKENEGTQEPVEIVQWLNESSSTKTVQLVVNKFSGAANPRLKFILLENGGGISGTEYPKSGAGDVVGPSIYGHAGAPGVIAVGAVRYEPRPGEAEGSEPYSSRGPVTHYYGPVEGTTPAPELGSPEQLSKPEVAATDCGRTTFFAVEPKSEPGVWRFCGTSAAAPHAAGVAALLMEDEAGATPAEVREALADSAEPFSGFGPCAQGGGLVEAVGALEAIEGAAFPPAATCEPPESPAGEVFVAPGEWGLESPPPVPQPVPTPTPTPQPQPAPAPVAPTTSFLKHPPKLVRTRSKTARVVFRFRSDQAGATFVCKIDKAAFRPCGSRIVHRFGLGPHVVRVKAVSSAGLADATPAIFRFRVKRVG